ncbi:MAG TPA: alpha/beta hydrolase [Actinophytocola sp.]|nr:alpha/beta hydrolase [Actinophytocola sp.]
MPPASPNEYLVRFTDTRYGRMRSRVMGTPSDAPPVVTVMGMAVSDYLLPAQAALTWTRAHLLDLPGLAGSGEPPRPLSVAEYGDAVAEWLDAAGLPPVVLAGHSSGTQVAAHAAAARPDLVAATVLASPTIDPAYRSMPKALLHWRIDSRYPMPGLNDSHKPEWRRAGPRRIAHLLRAHLDDRLEDTVARLRGPLLVLHGDQDGICTRSWAASLGDRLVDVPGPHTFLWRDPHAWSEPIRELAR